MITRKYNDEAISPVIGVMMMITITVLMAIAIAMFTFGMMGNTPKKQAEYVQCSDFYKIVDKYKTPDGFYVIFAGTSYPYQIYYNEFEEWKIGQYIDFNLFIRKPINLVEINESISGYRDACMEIP